VINPHPVMYTTVSGEEFSPKFHEVLQTRVKALESRTGMERRGHFVASVAEIDIALADSLAWGADALYVSSSPVIYAEMKRIVEFALRHKLPSAFIESPFVEAGGLLSYGSSIWGTFFDSLEYVNAVLRGANPAELPIKLPTQMELAINLTTAGTLGLTIPQSLLLRADKVIE
jgi:putative ABC transport system substrate-binding protein